MCVCVSVCRGGGCRVGLLNHIHVFQTNAIPLQVDAKLPGIVFNMKFLTFKSPRLLLIRVLLICDLKNV